MKTKSNRKIERYAAARRLQAPDATDLVWKQWGQALVEQYPREEWPARLEQVPKIYRPLITGRLIRLYGYEVEYERQNSETDS